MILPDLCLKSLRLIPSGGLCDLVYSVRVSKGDRRGHVQEYPSADKMTI